MNAIEAMTPVVGRARELDVRVDRLDDRTLGVMLRDTGVGLTSGQREDVFKAFQTTKASGMGIGLSICQSIVQAHDGRIWAAPNESGGVTFSFILPSYEEDA